MARSQSLFSILAFVTLALAIPPTNKGRQQPASKGKGTRDYCNLLHQMQLSSSRIARLRGSVVIAQMFEWDWDSVAAECTSFLGPAGYGFVQGKVKKKNSVSRRIKTDEMMLLPRSSLTCFPVVSPAQEHVQGAEWWTDYQPVSCYLSRPNAVVDPSTRT